MPSDSQKLIRESEQRQFQAWEEDQKAIQERKRVEEAAQQEAERKQQEEWEEMGEHEKFIAYNLPITELKTVVMLLVNISKALDKSEKRIDALEQTVKGLIDNKNVIIIE